MMVKTYLGYVSIPQTSIEFFFDTLSVFHNFFMNLHINPIFEKIENFAKIVKNQQNNVGFVTILLTVF